jgi:hypothetical protein
MFVKKTSAEFVVPFGERFRVKNLWSSDHRHPQKELMPELKNWQNFNRINRFVKG